jgi:hypothetical protein
VRSESHSLRAWAIGRAQMAIPSKECTLLHTIYNSSELGLNTQGPSWSVGGAPSSSQQDAAARAGRCPVPAPAITSGPRPKVTRVLAMCSPRHPPAPRLTGGTPAGSESLAAGKLAVGAARRIGGDGIHAARENPGFPTLPRPPGSVACPRHGLTRSQSILSKVRTGMSRAAQAGMRSVRPMRRPCRLSRARQRTRLS